MFNFKNNYISIDLGSVNTTVKYDETNNFLKEPTVVAYDFRLKKYIAAGTEAEKLVGRFPASRININPFKAGSIYDYEALFYFVKTILEKFGRLDRLKVMISLPYFPEQKIKERLKHDLLGLGVNEVYLDEEIHATAVYLEKRELLKVNHYLLVDIGANKSSLAIFDSNRIKVRLINSGSNTFNQKLKDKLFNDYGLILGDHNAEYIKRRFGSFEYNKKHKGKIKVKGIEYKTGLPIYLNISQKLTEKISRDLLDELSFEIMKFIKKLPENTQKYINKQGLVLSGGGSLLNDFSIALSEKTNLPVLTPPYPLDTVVIGGWDELVQISTTKKKKK